MSDSKEQTETVDGFASSVCYATNDRDATFYKVAFYWSAGSQTWSILCAGRNEDEFQNRVQHWIGKGIDRNDIREYECRRVV